MQMKRIILTYISISALLLAFGCADDNHGRIDQIDRNLAAPEPVEVTKVRPTAGGAVIWVRIPDDKNIKGIVATYKRGGVEVNSKISRYVDSLAVEGYADTEEHEIQVCSFNVNEDKSTPVTVKFNPLAPAIRTVTPKLIAATGGVKVRITGNEGKSDLAVCLLRDENLGNAGKPLDQIKWTEVTTMFTASDNITLTRRGIEPKEAIFGVYIRDRWGNVSDTLTAVLKPAKESAVPKEGFKGAYLKDDNAFSLENERSTYPLKGLWDGSGASETYRFLAVDKVPIPCWFTIDLGCEVKLSRIETLPRIGYPELFGDAHPRNFEFWGSLNPSSVAGNGEHGFNDSWVCLGKFIQRKPSGYNPDGKVGIVTPEDIQAFNAGNDFELDNEEYPHAYDKVRYLRVVLTSFASWSMPDMTVGSIQFGEVTPYGELIEQQAQ